MNLRCWSRRLAEGWRAWRRRRYWTSERQLDYLRTLLQADHRWLAHDKTADALTTRYLAALAPDWYSRVHADACCFRREIGLEPLTAVSALNSAERVERMRRVSSGELRYVDGPMPERGWD